MDIYKKTVLERFPEILSCLDRNENSFSFGCFDRNFWHYKIVDMASARLQEGILILALAYLDRETAFFQRKLIEKWIKAAFKFWLKIQKKDGSFDEWYPEEKSFVATAFSSYAVSEALLLLSDIEEKEKLVMGLKKAADWLLNKRDNLAINQNAGSLAAFYNIFLLTKEEKYLEECRDLVNFLENRQSAEGWFSEYGGADTGYLSLSLDYLAKYYLKSKDEKVFPILEKGLFFLSNFIHPDGSSGGVYGSRNTAYLIPSGIEILAKFFPMAEAISKVLRKSIENNSIVSIKNLDSRYLIQNGYTYLEASRFLNSRQDGGGSELFSSASYGEKYFSQAGIFIKSTPDFYFVTNCNKGGVFYFYDRKAERGIYNGGLLLGKKGKNYISCQFSANNGTVFSPDKAAISIKGKLKLMKDFRPTTLRFFMLRVLAGICRFIPFFSIILKALLREFLIFQKGGTKLGFERTFKIGHRIIIEDRFPAGLFAGGRVGGILEMIYTPSSRYFFSQLISSESRSLTREELRKGEIISRI